MSDKKNIDRLFQEKFKDFDVAPNDAVWSRISESLPNKKKKRRVIALWWQIGGVAAVIALLLTVGVSVFNSDTNNTEDLPIVNTEKTDSESNQGDDNLKSSTNSKQDELKNENDGEKVGEQLKFVDSDTEQEFITKEKANDVPKKDNVSNQLINSKESQQQLNAIVSNSDSNKKDKGKTTLSQKRIDLTATNTKDNSTKVAENTKGTDLNSKNSDATQLKNVRDIKSAIKNNIEENKTAVAANKLNIENADAETKNSEELKTENSIIEDSKKQAIEDAIAENTIDEKEEDKQNRWSIAPNVAPVYFSSIGQGSPIHSQFNGNSKSSDINMSYGIAGSYSVSKKLKIRTGINRVNLNQLTSDVVTFTGGEVLMRGENTEMTNVEYKDEYQSISYMDAAKYYLISKPDNYEIKAAGDIDQRFGFIEVPLELEYKLVDKKFGINVIGGFSTFFLNNNEIYVDIDGVSTLIGKANNLNDTSFSANFGLGLDYSLSKQWNINLEPTFKYQINTFNNTTGDFKPFFVGVYTGLSFKF